MHPPTRHRTAGFLLPARREKARRERRKAGREVMAQVEVGVLGATGAVGQMFVRLLEHHPDFKLTWLAASDRSAGKRYAETAPWRLSDTRPANAADIVVTTPTPGSGPKLVFSALDASVAEQIEGDFAKAGHVVVSNARNFRMHPAVPLLVPEVNADHLGAQRRAGRALEGPDRHQPELLDRLPRDGARAAASIRPEEGDGDDACRRSPARAILACRRSTSSATSCRSSAARKTRWRASRSASSASWSSSRPARPRRSSRIPA